MRVLITGASGFVGKNLKNKLQKLDYEVIDFNSSQIDLRDSNSLKIYKNVKFDQIYHLAAWTQAGDFSIHNQGNEWIYNQLINSNVLQYWKDHNPSAKFISFGTSCSYREGSDLKEVEYLIGEPIKSLYVYAMTKRMLQIGLQAINNQFALNYNTFVPSTLYGNGYNLNDKKIPHFIFDLIRKIVLMKKNNKTAVLWGDGYQERELIHIDDFLDIMIELNKKSQNEIFNVGAGKGYNIRYFASIICKILDIDPEDISYDDTKFVGAKSKVLNIDKMNSFILNKKQIALKDGIESIVYEFYKKIS